MRAFNSSYLLIIRFVRSKYQSQNTCRTLPMIICAQSQIQSCIGNSIQFNYTIKNTLNIYTPLSFCSFQRFFFQNINPFSHHNILITSWFKEKHNIQQKIHRQSILIHPNSLIIILMIKSAEVHCVRFLLLTSATINWSDVLLKLHACPNVISSSGENSLIYLVKSLYLKSLPYSYLII